MSINGDRKRQIRGIKHDIGTERRLVKDKRSTHATQTDKAIKADNVYTLKDYGKWADAPAQSDLKGYDDGKRFKSYAKIQRNTGHSGDDVMKEHADEYAKRYLHKDALKRITDYNSLKQAVAKEWTQDPSLRNLLLNLTDIGFVSLYNSKEIKDAIKENTGKLPTDIEEPTVTGVEPQKTVYLGKQRWVHQRTGYTKGRSAGIVVETYLRTGQQVYRTTKGTFASILPKGQKGTARRTTKFKQKTPKMPKPALPPEAKRARLQQVVDTANGKATEHNAKP
jgi:hypothetical protein